MTDKRQTSSVSRRRFIKTGGAAAGVVAAGGPRDAVVATDARRREVYWAVYADGRRTGDPAVGDPADAAAAARRLVSSQPSRRPMDMAMTHAIRSSAIG